MTHVAVLACRRLTQQCLRHKSFMLVDKLFFGMLPLHAVVLSRNNLDVYTYVV